jgi:hypothetical protein
MQSAQCGPVNTGPWLGDLSHQISHSSHSSTWSHWLTNQTSQSRTGSTADPMHRQHRKLPRKAAKNAGFNPENELKNPDKSEKIRPNPGKSG